MTDDKILLLHKATYERLADRPWYEAKLAFARAMEREGKRAACGHRRTTKKTQELTTTDLRPSQTDTVLGFSPASSFANESPSVH